LLSKSLTTTPQPENNRVNALKTSPYHASSPYVSGSKRLFRESPTQEGFGFDGESTSFVDMHPSRNLWPKWMPPAIAALESLSASQGWGDIIGEWITFEERLGFPQGTVRTLLIVLFPLFLI
jgi:hypothetical protein